MNSFVTNHNTSVYVSLAINWKYGNNYNIIFIEF